ncbi:hypothetical protein C5O23_10105 [Duncaniella muris]|uniref:Fibronectin type-III domain-containing protein n=4 Tax=Duncaniella muris TaxID=2094150 RepID=A0A2V1IJR3_9BACT|nr:hypothetical protein C5O23_10105 [Duncaniella muris]
MMSITKQLPKFLLLFVAIFFSDNSYVNAANINENKKTYEITSSSDFSEFYGMLCAGNTFADYTVVLTKDISFETGGKVGNRIFEGKFEGQGHKINDITTPLFTDNRGDIYNLHIASGLLRQSGTFCIKNHGCIKDCKNSANIVFSSSSNEGIHAGAFCDSNYGDIINCINEGNVTLELEAIYGSWSKAVSSCGGICAYSGPRSSIVYCINKGAIKNSGIYSAVTGGVVANAEYCSIVGCDNKGEVYSYLLNSSPSKGNITVESYQLQHVGGIAGHVLYCVLNRCRNYGTVQSNFQYLGGIAGYVGNTDVYNLENFGDLYGFEGYGFHSVSGIIPYYSNPYKRQYFINCINHGDIFVAAKYGVATGAGISAEIKNAYIANCYNLGAISTIHTGNMSAEFSIPQYNCENSEELNTEISNITDANAFIALYDSPVTLLKWVYDTGIITLSSNYLSHPIAKHGSCWVYVYPEDSDKQYRLKIWAKDETLVETISKTSRSPIMIMGLQPDTEYYFEIYSEDNTQFLDNGNFKTLKPNIAIIASSIGYDKIEFKQSCDAKGISDIDAYLLFHDKEQNSKKIEVIDSTIIVGGLDEETEYFAELIYTLNGKVYKSNQINVTTKPIIPQFSLISRTPYSLTLKCDNFEELKDFVPCLYAEDLKLYDFGGFKTVENKIYELDNEGKITLDSLLYSYSPQLHSKYIIRGEERFREVDAFSTLNWGGEGIIQLSPNAAMVHGLFYGMGQSVNGSNNRYDTARFYFRDATAVDDNTETSVIGACIDNRNDYAVTIPINSILYQYYISLQYSRYIDPKNNSKNGEWQIIDARKPTVEIVEPRFYNIRFQNSTLYCSCIAGEEKISSKELQYKIEEMDHYNSITLSTNTRTESLSRTLTSIVPQLTYLIRMVCYTENGKTYYSSIYRLKNGILELATDINNQQSTINNVDVSKIQVHAINDQIVIEGKGINDIVKIYNAYGTCVYIGQESNIQLSSKGVFIVLLGNKAYKLLL